MNIADLYDEELNPIIDDYRILFYKKTSVFDSNEATY